MSTLSESIPGLFGPTEDERKAFGDAWIGPDDCPCHKVVQVALYKGFSDGRDVMVTRKATPAVFYEIIAGSAVINKVWKPAFTIQFGSGRAELCAMIAKDIAQGFFSVQVGRH